MKKINLFASSVAARGLFLAGLLVLLSGALFGIWFKKVQLGFISQELIRYYPFSYWLTSVLLTCLLFILVWLILGTFYRIIFGPSRMLTFLAAQSPTFLIFVLVWANVPLKFCTVSFLFFQAVIMFLNSKKDLAMNEKETARRDWSAFFLMVFVYIISMSFFSPEFWNDPLASYIATKGLPTGNVPTSAPLHKIGYIAAKFHSFCELDPSYWGGIARPLTGLYSLVVPCTALFFDLPAVDVATYHRLLMAITWLACVMGSFGFYLFLSRGLGLFYPVALLGGILFVLSNRFFCQAIVVDYPAFYIYFLILPYVFLLTIEGYRRNSGLLCSAAGLVLGLPLYILAPHPQSVLIAIAFYHLYLLFLTLVGGQPVGWREKARLLLCVETASGLSVLGYLAPAVEAIVRGELQYFAHKEPIERFLLTDIATVDNLLAMVAGLLTALLIKTVLCCRTDSTRSEKDSSSLWPPFLLFAGIFLSLMLLYIPFCRELAYRFTGVLISDASGRRARAYFSFCSLTLFLICLQSCFLSFKKRSLSRDQKTAKWFGAAVILVSALFFITFAISGSQTLKSGRLVNLSAIGLKPRILFGAHRANLKGLEKDVSSLVFVKKEMSGCEQDLVRVPVYAQNYQTVLRWLGVSSVRDVSNESVPDVLIYITGLFDDFIASHTTPFPWGLPSEISMSQMNHYNNAILLNLVTSPFQRLMFVTEEDFNVGLSNGLLLNNSLTGIDARFMSGYAPTHFLYYHPASDFLNVGTYQSPGVSGWAMTSADVLSRKNRKILDIAGIDLFVVRKYFIGNILDKNDFGIPAKEFISNLADKYGFDLADCVIPKDYDPEYAILQNNRSYGLVYLAKAISYVRPDLLNTAQKHFKLPFFESGLENYYKFTTALAGLRKNLLSLNGKHTIILEDTLRAVGEQEQMPSGNSLTIENFIGNRSAFRVHCVTEPCRLVFNTAAISGWKAFSDKKLLPIQRANFAFLSVPVPKGDHLIWFEHRSGFAILGSFVSLLIYIAILAVLAIRRI